MTGIRAYKELTGMWRLGTTGGPQAAAKRLADPHLGQSMRVL